MSVRYCYLLLTEDGTEHGESSEDPGKALTAHEQRIVPRRKQPDQTEQTALQHCTEH